MKFYEIFTSGSEVLSDSYLALHKEHDILMNACCNCWINQELTLLLLMPAHSTLSMYKFLVKNKWTIPHSPLSPQLAPCDFFAYWKLKMIQQHYQQVYLHLWWGDWLTDWLICNWVQDPMVPMHLGLNWRALCVPYQFMGALLLYRSSRWPQPYTLISSGSNKKQPRYTCLYEAKASHSQRIWTEVSSSAPHLLHNGLSDSPTR
jgi:hypothetical protein